MLPIFRELADDRLSAIEQVNAGERPPMIYAGCYNGERLPPYDYRRRDEELVGMTGITSHTCIGGVNEDLIAKLRSEILMFYADAIEVILRTGDYASQELRQLERAAIGVAANRTAGYVRTYSEASGPINFCSRGTIDYYLGLDILSSCLAPVARGNNVVVANVGGRVSLFRLLSYEVRSGAPAAARSSVLAELGDSHVVAVPKDRRRFIELHVVQALYQHAHDELQKSGDLEATTQLFAPELPITLPVSEPNPFVSVTMESSRYLDVSFDVTHYGTAERIEFLATSKDATRAEERELARLIESLSFRPRFVDGTLAEAAPVVARYRLP
jgi:hypothetical protein